MQRAGETVFEGITAKPRKRGGKWDMGRDMLEILADYMTQEQFDRIAIEKNKFMEKDKVVQSLTEQVRNLELSKEQRLAVDKLLAANNESNTFYSQLSYVQGMKDCANLLRKLKLI